MSKTEKDIMFKGLTDEKLLKQIDKVETQIKTTDANIGLLQELKYAYQTQLKAYHKDLKVRLSIINNKKVK
jgi:restriction endonuclease S subunit